MKFAFFGLSILLLVSCGGGSDDTDKITSNTPDTSTPEPLPVKAVENNSINRFDESASIGQSIELFLYFPQTSLSDIQWSQTSGEPVPLLTSKTKGIAFTPEVEGNYSFEVSFRTANGDLETLTHDINVDDIATKLTTRLGHVVAEENDVSLRVQQTQVASQSAQEIITSTIRWQQTSGPLVNFTEETSGKTAVFFTTPSVQQDTFITFEVSAEDGENLYRDTIAVLIENKPAIAKNAIFDERVSDTFSFNPNSPYKNSLVNCLYNNHTTVNSICTLNTLPLIAHDTLTPSVEDIMDRVIVSHQWMGDRFKAFLEQYDSHNDLKNMLRAVTGIVISYDIRPSFYWAATGAIYLDANNFWLTVDERDTLNKAPDYRTEFGNELQFDIPWRYVRDNDYLSTYISEETRRDRELEEGVYTLIGLMYHELAHANDYFPKSYWASMDTSKSILSNIPQILQSELLQQSFPLNGNEMFELAQVSFHGASASNTQKSYTPQDVAQLFSTESAPQYYNYSSINEDYAMLFDGFMMKARYNIDRDVAVTNHVGSDGYATDYIVEWGQRGRLGESHIKSRVAFVVPRVLPEYEDYQTTIDNLPVPIPMEKGKNWIENLVLSPNSAEKQQTEAQLKVRSNQYNEAYLQRPANEFNTLFQEKGLPSN